MLYYTGHILDPVLNTVARWLINAEVCEEGRRHLLRFLIQKCRVWKKIMEQGLDHANQALAAAKEEVMKFCCEYEKVIEELGKFAVKTSARTVVPKVVVKVGVKGAAKVSTKSATKAAAKMSIKSLAKGAVSPMGIGIVSDLAQGGLEYVGFTKTGRAVGGAGNIASGAMIGGVVGGPAGAAVGALLGFGVWGVGEVTGRLVDRVLGE